MTTFAQMPDASGWKKGEEITTKIGWGNLSFEEPEGAEGSMNYWKLDGSAVGFTKSGGLFEAYSGTNVDLYQYVQLPAGMYRVKCQGYYRCGNSWADDPSAFGTENWLDNALLYVQNGTYDIESEAFTPARTFKTPLMPRLFLNYGEQIYVAPEGEADWMNDGNYGNKGWGPTSVPGSLAWFNAGLYQPYVDEDYDETKIKYNTTTFWLKEDGYVKVGVSKIEPKNEDSFMATNFKMYYEGEVDPEMAELMALQEEVQEYYDQLMKIRSNYSEGMIYSLIDDAIQDFEDDYGTPDELEAEQCAPAKEYLQDLIAKVQAAETAYNLLTSVLPDMERLYNNTDYAGKDDFQTALKAAQNCIDPDYEMVADDNFDSFKKAYDNILTARAAYLQTQPKVDGVYDFTALIAYPWFCNPEYEPTWDAETGKWIPNQEVLDGGWSEYDDVDGTGTGKDDEVKPAIPVANKVTLSTKSDAIGQWFQVNNGLVLYWNDNLTCVKKWDMPHSDPDDYKRDVSQRIVNVPNGYYKLKALAQTWMNDWSDSSPCKNRIYIESGNHYSESAYLEPGGWWGKDINQWKELETEMIEVSNGELLISSRDNGFAAFTGFRLYYYGETPDFAALLKPMYDKAKANIENNLSWAGDIAKANALLAAADIEKVSDGEGFVAAQAAIAEANSYANTASAVVNNWKGFDNFIALVSKYEDGTPEYEIVNTAIMESSEIGEGANDTYELAVQNDKDYAAYVAYLDFRASMGELIKDDAVAKVVEEQNESLIKKMANDKRLAEMQAALGVPYNRVVFADMGAANATAEQPLDITNFIVNPSFTDSPSDGWSGETPTVNEYGRGNAELWN
ncbi:MAG: hypothetical protein K2O61_03750, partial [Bacteroidaceae bacterium]|nr:hypothetical protein [Bacteroidaceae bacterium]